MPPNRRSGKKKSCGRVLRSLESPIDDVFEESKLPKKTFCRFKARITNKKVATKSKLNDSNKHVDKKQAMATSPATKVDSPNSEIIDVEDDFDLDLARPVPTKRKRSPKMDDSEGSSEAHRRKIDDATNNDSSNILITHEKSMNISTAESNEANDSNERNTDANDKEDVPTEDEPEDKSQSSEAGNLDVHSDIELSIESEIEFELGAETETAHENNVVKEADVETENVDQTEIGAEAEILADANKDKEAECSPNPSNEQNHPNDNDNDSDDADENTSQGIADDDYVSIFEEEDMFDDDDFRSPSFSPIAPAKKPAGMSVPNWKKKQMENVKSTEPSKVDQSNLTIKRTINFRVTNDNATAPAGLKINNHPNQQDKSVFKISQENGKDVGSLLNRDPRFPRNIIRVVQNTVETTESTQAQSAAQIIRKPIVSNESNAPRIPIKERLGTRPIINNSTTTPSAPPPRLISNEQTVTPPAPPALLALPKSLSSTFLADRINKPVSTNVDPRKQPPNVQSIVNTPKAQPQNVTPPMPAFALNPKRKKVAQLLLPSFATGPQQYEPVFTYLFKRTCRYFMMDLCQNPNECQLEHRLPDHSFFCESIDKMFQHSVIDLYDNYMRRNVKLFNYYFTDFCKFFGKNKLTDHLKQMVEDCIDRNQASHFKSIVDGFILAGHSYAQAVADVIRSIHNRTAATSKEVVGLILNQRIENIRPFISALDSIGQQENFKFKVEWLNRLLLICNEKNVYELFDTVWHLIQRDQKNLFKVLDSEQLTRFVNAYGKH